MFNKKAAMFGLDARIALAIFGALSVIAGASLYSAIQRSQSITMIRQLEEISNAVNAYRFDTGTLPLTEGEPSVHGYFPVSSKLKDLTINDLGKAGWKGPYISMNLISNFFLSYNDDDFIITLYGFGDASLGSNISSDKNCHISSGNCNIFIGIKPLSAEKQKAIKIFNTIEEYIDGPLNDNSYRTGKIRYRQSGNTISKYLEPSLGSPDLRYLIAPYPRNHLQ